MERDNIGLILLTITIFGFGMITGSIVGGCEQGLHMQQEAVDRGAAQYNPKTSEFEWLLPTEEREEK